MSEAPKVLDLARFSRGKAKIDKVIDLISRYQEGSEASVVHNVRHDLANVLIRYCKNRQLQIDLGISDEALSIIKKGEEIPQEVLEELVPRFERIRDNYASTFNS